MARHLVARVLLFAAVAACGGAADDGPVEPAGPPPPWKAGTEIRTQVYTAEDLVVLGGRVDTRLDFECRVDELNAPWFYDCPHEVWLNYSDDACQIRNVAIDANAQPLEVYASAFVDGELRYYNVEQDFPQYWSVRPDPNGQCTIPTSGPNQRTAVEMSADEMRLGTVVDRVYGGVAYSALETADGFSVVTLVDGGQEVMGETSGRLRARWSQNGEVRSYRGLHDTLLGVDCVAAVAGDGTIRCVPDGRVAVGVYFAQDGCQQGTGAPIYLALELGYATSYSAYLPGGRHVLRVRQCGPDRTTGYSGRFCQPATGYACTDVPFTDFAELTLTTE